MPDTLERAMKNCMHFLRKLCPTLALLAAALHPFPSSAQTPVLTYHGDATRSGLYDTETLLTPANVNSTQFGKLFSYPVDGMVDNQPLYVPNVSIAGGTHNVVYVTTQHDSVFAFDADNPGSGAPLWQTSFINPSGGITTVPIGDEGCSFVGFTEIGIMGTPVINLTTGGSTATGTLYVVAKTKEVTGTTTNYVFRLHALDITTGLEQFGGPVVISASIIAPDGSTVNFTPLSQFQRSALLLQNDVVYVAFGSNGCDMNATGWLFAMDSGIASGVLQQLTVFDTAPDQAWGDSIWMSGGGPAGDGNGNVFLATANGVFDFNTGGPDLGDSILQFNYSSGALQLEDYFTPYNQDYMGDNDKDLGSGGVMLLPTQPGPNPNLLVQGGKVGAIYLVNRNAGSMGGYNPTLNSCLQSLLGALGPLFSTPTYWNNTVYFTAYNDYIKGFSLNNGLLSTSPTVATNRTYSGSSSFISANGSTNGILWAVFGPTEPALYAFDATSLIELYNSTEDKSRDTLGPVVHFVPSVVANGKLYIGTASTSNGSALLAYGLLPNLTPTGGNNQSGTVGTQLPVTLTVQAVNSLGVGVPGVTVNFSGGAGGTFSNPSSVTDSTGTVYTAFTLPNKAQTLTLVAAATGYVSTTLTEVAAPGPPVSIGAVSGANQTATAGSPLPAPIVMKLKDQYGNGVPGLPVTFTGGAGGSFSANPVTTSSTGTATVSYTLPRKAETVNITASYSTLTPVHIQEHGVAGTPTTQTLVSGNTQSGPPNTQLTNPLVVEVTDTYGNPVAGVSVSFSDNGAGGIFSSDPVTTGSNGQASVNYTTSSQAGTCNITASATNVNSVMFTETVQ
jgi:hypothetical protein